MSHPDIDRILADPAAIFSEPSQVLNHPDLSYDEKMLILERWELDARELMEASSEGMPNGKPHLLSQVRDAINRLQKWR